MLLTNGKHPPKLDRDAFSHIKRTFKAAQVALLVSTVITENFQTSDAAKWQSGFHMIALAFRLQFYKTEHFHNY